MMENVGFKKIKIAVLGSNGQLGQEFKHLAPSYEFVHFDFFSRKALDITDKQAFEKILHQEYDYLINCAAYTAVDKAEQDVEACYEINSVACEHIMDYLKGRHTKLVHFSSDYVYHTYHGFALILRTSWVISSFGHNFVKTMLRLGSERSSLAVINDQYGAPTYARHLATAVIDIILKVTEYPKFESVFNATYNYANEGIITWYDLASQTMETENLPCQIQTTLTKDYPTAAERPLWSVLSKKKIKNAFDLEIPHWYTGLIECLQAIKSIDV